jgi:hypothetical protein
MSTERTSITALDLQFVDIRVEYLVHEAYAGRLERILVRQLDVDLPDAASKRSLSQEGCERWRR